ncbi:ulp1 protease family, C-terminal catalytic domain-containing protein [Tanacetum coccineum]
MENLYNEDLSSCSIVLKQLNMPLPLSLSEGYIVKAKSPWEIMPGILVEKDFDISDEVCEAGKVIVKNYTVNVMTTLEIRLYWARKGTINIPKRGVYGPLILAISIHPNFWVQPKDGSMQGNGNGVSAGTVAGIVVGAVLLQDGTLIAVKQLSSKSKQGNKKFLNELGVISALQHPNLVKLHGCCIQGNQLLGFAYDKREALLDDKRTAKLHSEKEVQDRNNVLKWKLKNLEENLQQFSFAFLSELVRTLRNGVKKFEDDHIMIDFCKKYVEMFNDNEFNLYESSKDDDSEGEPDKDNENNNHDDDGAPTADANKQKESDNQKKEQNKEEIDNQTEESGSEGTEESGSEGTKENGSEGTEGGSDGKEEKMNGDDREVIVQMDIDNQNEELNKEKDANETEDNDIMNNNEMKNDSVQEKQDVDKDENVEKRKNEELHKEKDANETEDNDNVNNNEMKNDSVQEKQDVDKDENAEKEKVKTEKGKQDKADKVDNVQEKQDNDKEEIGEDEFWNTQFTDSHDFIFETKEGNATIQDYMQTLAPTLKIKSNVIDTYCLVLNHKQGMNNKEKKTKQFFHIGMIKKEDGKKYDEVKQYKAFSDTMKNEFKKDDELKKMKDLEMKNMFSMHLKEVQHQRAKDVLNKKPTILRPKWGTKDNNTDCRVFLMMHMENYNGETARNWNLEFLTEEKGNTYDIIKMRMRFAAKILTHEINIHHENISKEALEFADRNKEKKAREALLLKPIRVKKQKQESERVASAI